jgi:broad specificity phosphatase PhoE
MSNIFLPNVNVYFVRHAESCANISSFGLGKISHPPLSYKGIQQAINLGINNEIIGMDFDKYYCSPSLRTIMTACLALRKKSIVKKITLYLNSYLIEHQSFIGSYDQQNSIVPQKNLKKMVNYIKLWFEQKYFDNYIDYEFVYLMYDLVLLLYYNNQFNDYKDKMKQLLLPTCTNRKQILLDFLSLLDKITITTSPKIIIKNKQTDNINDIYNNILQFIIEPNKFMIYQELYTENVLDYKQIKERLTLFTKKNYNFISNINFDYNYTEKKPNIEQFINDEINKSELNNKKILCFTHGEILRKHFKLKSKLQNTEIVHYNHKKSNLNINREYMLTKIHIKELKADKFQIFQAHKVKESLHI